MSGIAISVTILGSLLSGIIGSIATVYFLNRIEDRKIKIDTLRRLLGNRDDLNGPDFTRAANEIIVIFRNHPLVLNAVRDLHRVACTPGKPNINDALVVLLKEAATACGLSPKHLPDTAFLQVLVRATK